MALVDISSAICRVASNSECTLSAFNRKIFFGAQSPYMGGSSDAFYILFCRIDKQSVFGVGDEPHWPIPVGHIDERQHSVIDREQSVPTSCK
jgi:hypothetical protein